MDEVLDLLEKNAKCIQKNADETKEAIWKQSAIYEQLHSRPKLLVTRR